MNEPTNGELIESCANKLITIVHTSHDNKAHSEALRSVTPMEVDALLQLLDIIAVLGALGELAEELKDISKL